MEQGPPLAGGKEEVGAKGQIDERAAKRTTNRVESRINLRAEGLEQAEQSRMGEQDGQDEQPGRGAADTRGRGSRGNSSITHKD